MKKNIFIIAVIIFVIFGFVIMLYRGAKPARPKGLVAFVIDDWGYNRRNIDLLLQIERPLTLSILPGLRYSNYVSEASGKGGELYDIILHLPLESKGNIVAERNTIRTNMEEARILSLLEDNIKTVPGLIGVSGHQGSKATEDKRVMRIILSALKKKDLFFLDSATTADSVCPDVARDIKLRFAQRDVFLDLTDQTDLENFEAYIRGQIHELASIAVKEGKAIGIGHNKRTTLKVIKDIIPELEEQGIRIVPLKELMR